MATDVKVNSGCVTLVSHCEPSRSLREGMVAPSALKAGLVRIVALFLGRSAETRRFRRSAPARGSSAACLVLVAFLTCSAHSAPNDFDDAGSEQVSNSTEAPTAASAGTVSQAATPACPPGARLVRHNGTPKCAWESDLNRLPGSPTRGARTIIPDVWLCFVLFGGGVPVYDYIGGFLIVYCINLTELFDPCGTCSDGKQCQISDGEAECVYECGADEVGGGQTRCQSCGDGEVPNAGGTACETCEHGESSTAGTCNPDPCEGVTCPENAQCKAGQCQCEAGYKPTQRPTGSPGELDTVLECVPDPCHGVVCGSNSACTNGTCQCNSDYEDPDEDGNCTRICTNAAYDAAAKASLESIDADPWEQSESYSCENGRVTIGSGFTTEPNYLYSDYPTNSNERENPGDVCTVNLSLGTGGGGHSHPHFVWPRDRGVQCGPRRSQHRITRKRHVDSWNEDSLNFSQVDKDAAENANKGKGRPLYLVVPERDCVKVYRKNERGGWRQSSCL